MHLGLIIDTNDPERVWNAFRLANEAIEAGHDVETFLLGDGVEAADIETEKFNHWKAVSCSRSPNRIRNPHPVLSPDASIITTSIPVNV